MMATLAPGGDWLLASEYLGADYSVVALSPDTGRREVLVERAVAARYLPTGHLKVRVPVN